MTNRPQKQCNLCIYKLTISEAGRQAGAEQTAVLLRQLHGVTES
jgi:hypothetical protein